MYCKTITLKDLDAVQYYTQVNRMSVQKTNSEKLVCSVGYQLGAELLQQKTEEYSMTGKDSMRRSSRALPTDHTFKFGTLMILAYIYMYFTRYSNECNNYHIALYKALHVVCTL